MTGNTVSVERENRIRICILRRAGSCDREQNTSWSDSAHHQESCYRELLYSENLIWKELFMIPCFHKKLLPYVKKEMNLI